MDLHRFDLAPIELAYELLAYQRHLAETCTALQRTEAYLFYEPKIRFMPEAEDILVPLPELQIQTSGSGVLLSHAPTKTSIPLPNIDRAKAQQILSSLDGTSTLLGLQLATRIPSSDLDAFLVASFGRVVFAPRTLERFEARISGAELVRFVGSPYEIRRTYWSNMADCRERILRHLFACEDFDAWLEELRRLHIVTLIGADARSYYRPQSPLGARDPRPGALYDTPTRTIRQNEVTLLLDGPRVSAPLVGGRNYHALLAASLGDNEALLPDRTLTDETGNAWGNLCLGFARDDVAPAPWFCPPRPMTRAHFEQLHAAFRSSIVSSSVSDPGALSSLADFHWQFIRMHPFRCANQSLGMNLVNAILSRQGSPGIPHLLLDQCALRFSRQAYRTLFARAVRQFGIRASSTLERWRTLAELRQRFDRLVSRIGNCSNEDEALAQVDGDPEGARVALLSD